MIVAILVPITYLFAAIVIKKYPLTTDPFKIFCLLLIVLYVSPVLFHFNKAANLIFKAQDEQVEKLKDLRYKMLNDQRFKIEHSEAHKNLSLMIETIQDQKM